MKKYRVILKYSGTLVEVFEAETEGEALEEARNELSPDDNIYEEEVEELKFAQ